jgi:hypothetical protein
MNYLFDRNVYKYASVVEFDDFDFRLVNEHDVLDESLACARSAEVFNLILNSKGEVC